MKEAYASFPPLVATQQQIEGGATTQTITQPGWDFVEADAVKIQAGKMIPIDLRGLNQQEKLLKINSLHMARLPSYDNTYPKVLGASATGFAGVYQVVDMHLITTSPIVQETNVDIAGIAPANNQAVQVQYAAKSFGTVGYTTNNSYPLATPGLMVGDSGNTNLPNFNLDPNMIVFCQTDLLATNVQSDPQRNTLLVPVDSSVYGMADLAGLDTLYCYRFVYGSWVSNVSGTFGTQIVNITLGSSIVQMNTEAVSRPALERLQVMDSNFNTTNPLVR
tara:strand:+ start:800 stop:1630 length:831 start_codon:yes stop_codon:yes gene_type:complete